MIRAKRSLATENLAKPAQGCKLFHVEQRFESGNLALGCRIVPCGTWLGLPEDTACSTWNNDSPGFLLASRQTVPRETILDSQSGPVCSTWNLDPLNELFGSMSGISMETQKVPYFHLEALICEDLFVPTKRRRRKE